MGIIMSGIDHTKAGVDIRSVFSFTKKKTGELYESIRNIPAKQNTRKRFSCAAVRRFF